MGQKRKAGRLSLVTSAFLLVVVCRLIKLNNGASSPTNDFDNKTWDCSTNDVSCQYIKKCGKAPLNPLTSGNNRILNGQNQTFGEWPFYVWLHIQFKQGMEWPKKSCGGTLVSDRHVLTAAHCVWQHDKINWKFSIVRPERVRVILGYHDGAENEFTITHRASNICASYAYTPFPIFGTGIALSDWALIELAEPVTFNNHVQPACLPFRPIKKRGKESKCYSVGRGKIREDKDNPAVSVYPVITQKLRVEKVECTESDLGIIDKFQECYSNFDKPPGGTCSGDSGGPVLCLNEEKRWTVVGVVSSGSGGCYDTPDQLRVDRFTPITHFLGMIKRECKF